MNKAQLNAISRAYAEKARKENELKAAERGLDVVFKYGTYKRIDALLRASDERLSREIKTAFANCEKRLDQLVRCGCSSYKLDEARKDHETLKRLKEKIK